MNRQELRDLSKDKKIIVDFYADWCRPCMVLKPKLEAAQEKYTDIEFIYINVDEHDKDQLKKEFGVKAIPNIQFWTGGVRTYFTVGTEVIPVIEEKIEKFNNKTM